MKRKKFKKISYYGGVYYEVGIQSLFISLMLFLFMIIIVGFVNKEVVHVLVISEFLTVLLFWIIILIGFRESYYEEV